MDLGIRTICSSIHPPLYLVCYFIMLSICTYLYPLQTRHNVFQGFGENNLCWTFLSNEGLFKRTATNFIKQLSLAVMWLLGFTTPPIWNSKHTWGGALLYCHYCSMVHFAKSEKYLQLIIWEMALCAKMLKHDIQIILIFPSVSKMQDEGFLKHWCIVKFTKPMKESQQIFTVLTPVIPIRFGSKIFSFVVVWSKGAFYP